MAYTVGASSIVELTLILTLMAGIVCPALWRVGGWVVMVRALDMAEFSGKPERLRI